MDMIPATPPCSEDDGVIPATPLCLKDADMIPATPLCSEDDDDDDMIPLTPPCWEAVKEKRDMMDGCLSSIVFDGIKSAVYHLLDLTIRKYRVDRCYGCKIDHPSQKQHECLEVLEDDFFQNHYYRLITKLFTPRFIPAVQHLLFNRRYIVSDRTVRVAAQTLLNELKPVKRICEELSAVYEKMDPAEIELLQGVSDCYTKGC